MRGFAAMCLARFRRSLAAVYEVFKGSDALCARRNLFVGGRGGLNHAWNYLGVLVLMQITGDVRIALSISVWGMRWISWLRLANGCGLWI